MLPARRRLPVLRMKLPQLLAALLLVVASGLRLPPLSRRGVIGAAFAASAPALRAVAAYGEAANQAPPALVPSPFYPTGEMAKTCEVVAAGREDVCLKPLKMLSAYDEMRLRKASDALKAAGSSTPASDEAVRLIGLVEAKEWATLAGELGCTQPKTPDAAPKKCVTSVAGLDVAKLAAAVSKKAPALMTDALVKLAASL